VPRLKVNDGTCPEKPDHLSTVGVVDDLDAAGVGHDLLRIAAYVQRLWLLCSSSVAYRCRVLSQDWAAVDRIYAFSTIAWSSEGSSALDQAHLQGLAYRIGTVTSPQFDQQGRNVVTNSGRYDPKLSSDQLVA